MVLEKLKSLFSQKTEESGASVEDLYSYIDDVITPSQIKIESDKIRIDNKWNRIFMAAEYPHQVEKGFLDSIIRLKGNFDISLHIQPIEQKTAMSKLNKNLTKLRADRLLAEKHKKDTGSYDLKIENIISLLRKVQIDGEKLFYINFFINGKDTDQNQLDLLTTHIEANLHSVNILPKIPVYRQRDAFISAMPVGRNMFLFSKASRIITGAALSAIFPFTAEFLELQKDGVIWGINQSTGVPIVQDNFAQTNPNILVLAMSGGGKSYFMKNFLSELIMKKTKVFVIDPEDEYIKIAKELGGSVVEISNHSDTIINVMDLMGQNFDEKQMSLLTAFKIMFGGNLTEPQQNAIEKAIRRAYSYKGIFPDDPATWKNEPPVLGDVLHALRERLAEIHKVSGNKAQITTYYTLISRLEKYVEGMFNFLNKQTRLDLENEIICFHIKNMPSSVKPIMMFLIMEYVSSQMRKDRSRKILVVDEGWLLLKYKAIVGYIYTLAKRGRKYNLASAIITQEVEDLLSSPAGKAVLANASTKVLLRQNETAIDVVSITFKLTEAERRVLQAASPGEGVLMMDNKRYHFKLATSPKIHSLITTNPDELRKKELEEDVEREKKEAQLEWAKVDARVDLNRLLYKKKELTPAQIKYLRSNGFIETKQMGFERKGTEWYLLKPASAPYNTSAEHEFLVRLIEYKIKKYTNKVTVAATKEPDIVFENKDGYKIAIEVESGTLLHTKPEKLEKKVEELKKNFGNNWFFVVTKSALQKDYTKYGPTLTRTAIPEVIGREFNV